MSTYHAAVWLDHNEAKIFHVTRDAFDKIHVASPSAHTHLHRKSGPGADAGKRAPEDHAYYRDIAKALSGAEEILVIGPAGAKLELVKYAEEHERPVHVKIVGVETVDHPSDGQIVALARRYFTAYDAVHASGAEGAA